MERKSKTDVISAVVEETGLTEAVVTKVVNSTFNNISKMLVVGDRVNIFRFGSFFVDDAKGREYRHIKTGEAYKVPDRQLPKCKFSKCLSDAVK